MQTLRLRRLRNTGSLSWGSDLDKLHAPLHCVHLY